MSNVDIFRLHTEVHHAGEMWFSLVQFLTTLVSFASYILFAKLVPLVGRPARGNLFSLDEGFFKFHYFPLI